MELFTKEVSKGGKVSYKPYVDNSANKPVDKVEEEKVVEFNLNDAQCLTAAGALGVTLLAIYKRHMPEHKRNAKKMSAVHDAILGLYAGSGQAIDVRLADVICKSWDATFKAFADGVDVEGEEWNAMSAGNTQEAHRG